MANNSKGSVQSSFNLKNNIVFSLVMEDPKITKDFLERCFNGRTVKTIHLKENFELSTEKTIIADIDSKSVRLDVLFEDDDNLYDIEMQTTSYANLSKRMRYYSSIMDVNNFKRGEGYDSLKTNYVIFICDFDFGRLGAPVYFFENWDCKNN